MIRPEYELEALIDLLASARERGSVASPLHPALARAKGDGYAIIQLHDEGKLCEVWSGLDPAGREVAIKCVRESVVEPTLAERLLTDEYTVISELRGAAGIEPIARGGGGLATYLVLPWVEGEPIDQAAAMDPAKAPRWTRSALERLADIHAAGVIHGDLKPEHLIATAGGVVVLDFGLARRVAQDGPSLVPRIAGKTPAFAPPDAEPSQSADAYSMGRVLERLLPHLSGSDAAATRRVVSLSAEPRSTTDGGALLARYDGTLRRRRRVVRSATLAGTATTLVAGVLGLGVAVLGQWPEMFAMAVPGVVVERAPEPLSPWSAAFVELAASSEASTVLHRPRAIAARTAGPTASGEIAWLLHTDEIEIWSPSRGALVTRLPAPDTVRSIGWGERGLLVGTQSGAVWEVIDGEPRLIAQLAGSATAVVARDGGAQVWSHQSRSIVRVTPEGVQALRPRAVAATPLGGASTEWAIVDDESRRLLAPLREGEPLGPGEEVTAAYQNVLGDVALGLSSGDFLLSSADGPLVRHQALDRHAVTGIAITPDGGTVLIGGRAVYAYEVARGEVVASRPPADAGAVFGLSVDKAAGTLTVITNWSAETWQLIDPEPPSALR